MLNKNNLKDSQLRILFVEDDEDDVFIIKEMIHEGMSTSPPVIDHYASHKEALKQLETTQYDICMFDYRLGAIDGIYLLNMTREMGITAPIIVLTGQGDQEVAVEAMKAGANDYLTKGKLTSETLCNSIRYSIQLHHEAKRREEAEILLKKSHEELTRKNSELQDSLKKLQTAQNQILRSEKLAGIGRLAAGVCHEILNPLNIISGHVQALNMERTEDESLAEDMNSIMEEINRIEKIISGLLKFSRKGEVELRFIDINQELDSVLSIVEKEMLLANIELVRDYSENLPRVFIDSDRMRQVFLNIINNAKYAMQNGGSFTVSTQTIFKDRRKRRLSDKRITDSNEHIPGGIPFLRISFQDTGPGIRKEDMNKLFDPFFTTKPEDKGTGLGLSVCHAIIEKHSGSMEVESNYGHGATFIIDLPLEVSQEKIPVEMDSAEYNL